MGAVINNTKKLWKSLCAQNGEQKFDFVLLLFLILISNSTYSLKYIAIFGVLLYWLFKKRKSVLKKQRVKPLFKRLIKDKTIWFYLILIVFSIINLLLDFSTDYAIVVIVGIVFFWVANIALYGGVLHFVDSNSYQVLINTLKLFVVLNFLLSIIDLTGTMIATQSLTPYTSYGNPAYGPSTGDFIRGFFGVNHLSNSIISTFLLIYFFIKGEYKIAFLSLFTVLLASSNLCTLIIVFFLIAIFFLYNIKVKYYTILFLAFMTLFYVQFNPINLSSILSSFHIKKEDSYSQNKINSAFHEEVNIVTEDNKLKELRTKWEEEHPNSKLRIVERENEENYGKEYNSQWKLIERIQIKKQDKQKRRFLEDWRISDSINKHYRNLYDALEVKKINLNQNYGLLISFKQTKKILLKNTKTFLIGNGIGNFSSQLAFNASKLSQGSQFFDLMLPRYEHHDFKYNHEAVWLETAISGREYHSVTHRPYSTYNTLFGEYGVLGFLAFICFYIFTKLFQLLKQKQFKFALLILPLFLILLGTNYWFETFELIMFFELIIHAELKLKKT